MSDEALKIVRDKLRNVTLLIVNEISMVSNVTLMYMHLRLSEIFQTEDIEDGWFGKKTCYSWVIFCSCPPFLKARFIVLFHLSSLPNLLDA